MAIWKTLKNTFSRSPRPTLAATPAPRPPVASAEARSEPSASTTDRSGDAPPDSSTTAATATKAAAVLPATEASDPSMLARALRTPAAVAPLAARALATSPEYTIQLATKFDLHRLESGPPTEVTVSKDTLIQMYKDMVVMRRMETAADALYKQKLIRGFLHLNIGQEAIAVGMEHGIEREDAIISAYRCHGFTMMRGGSVKSILAELMGRKDGITKGKGGSMHMFAHNFYGGNGIVGAQVPVGAGIALAQQYLGHRNITFALYGDGAANQGQIFEAYNMAKLWKLPVVFGCENNRYGMGTSANRAAASTEYYTRGDYVPGVKVNGMDVLACYSAAKWAKTYAPDHGPLVFEFNTYRYGGHSMSDPGTTYRSREEIQHMRSTRDPIQGLKNVILEVEAATEADLKGIDKQAKEDVDKAVEEAKLSPEPAVEEMWTEIYQKGTEPPTLRGVTVEQTHRF